MSLHTLTCIRSWHHDISPDNILVVSRKGGSPYECDFKIADLGLSSFRRHSSSSGDATDEDKHGSYAYGELFAICCRTRAEPSKGAPETHRSSDSEQSQRSHLQVPQNADVWSMGCILSEVITWVTEGQNKLREYRRRRPLEVGKTFSTREDRFHCNGEVLDTVNQLLEELIQNRRRHDYVTPAIVQVLVHSSIVIDHNARSSALQLFYHSRRILREAQQKLDRGRSVSDGALGRKKRLPPNLPPRSASTSSAGTFEVETENWHRPRSTDFQSRDTHNEPVQNALVQKPVHNSVSRNRNPSHTNSSKQSENGHQQPDLARRGPERVSSRPVSLIMQRQQYARSPAHKAQIETRSRYNPLGIVPDTYDTTQAPPSPLRPRQNRHSPTSAGGPAPRPLTTEGISHLPRFSDSDPFMERGVASSDLLFEASDIDEESSSRYRLAPKNRPHPRMSVNEGLIIKKAKDHGQNVEYPRQALIRTLDAVLRKRDHVCSLICLPSQPLIDSLLARANKGRRFLSTTLRVWHHIGIRPEGFLSYSHPWRHATTRTGSICSSPRNPGNIDQRITSRCYAISMNTQPMACRI